MPESDDLRQFIRETVARHERIWRDELAELRAMREKSDREWQENHEEHRAQRQALLHILERLQNGGAQA